MFALFDKSHKYLIFTFFFILIAFPSIADNQNLPDIGETRLVAGQVKLTPQEQSFIREHPDIRFGISADWDPYVIKRADGRLEGYEVDILNHINAVTGTNIQLVAGQWSEIVEQAKSMQLDGLAASSASDARGEFFRFSDSRLTVYPAFVVPVDSERKISSIEDLAGETVAILDSNRFYELMLAEFPEVKVLKLSSETNAVAAMVEGNASAVIVATTSFDKHYKKFSRLIKIGYVAIDRPLRLLYSIREDWPELVSIVNKGLASLPQAKFNEIYTSWFGQEPPEVRADLSAPVFTAEELSWLAKKHVVRARVGEYMPYYSVSDGIRGMTIDYLKIISAHAGFEIEYVPWPSWSEALENVRRREKIDLLPTVYITPDRQEYLAFTREYLRTPSVITTRDDSSFVGSMNDLAGLKVVVERNSGTHEWLTREYPELDLVVMESTGDTLTALSTGEGDAYIGNLMVISYTMRRLGLTNIKVAAPSPLRLDKQAMGVRKDWPELVSIINKTLAVMTPEEQEEIRQRWLPPVQFEYGVSKADIVKWVGWICSLLVAIIAVILIWNKKLTEEVSARRVTERKLADSEKKYRELFERSADAILIIESDLFVDCNQAAVDMLGYQDKSEFLGLAPWEISPASQPDDRSSLEKAKEMVATAHEEGSLRFEWLHTRANGEVFPVEVLLTDVSTERENVLHVVWRDISVRKAVEQIKDELTEDLARKNQELERFTYTVSHDLKSPLITIQGFAGMLEQSLGDTITEEVRQQLDYINAATRKMYSLLEDLLELSRIGRIANPDETVDLGEIAREALSLVEGLLADCPVIVRIADDLPSVTGDRQRLREVMQNLLENAVKYLGEPEQPLIEVGIDQVDGRRACYVRDNGIGIDPRYHEKVFGLFERLNAEGEGTGVGLAQVKRIVEVHGGEIWVESEGLGQGSTFWFTLPWQDVPRHSDENPANL